MHLWVPIPLVQNWNTRTASFHCIVLQRIVSFHLFCAIVWCKFYLFELLYFNTFDFCQKLLFLFSDIKIYQNIWKAKCSKLTADSYQSLRYCVAQPLYMYVLIPMKATSRFCIAFLVSFQWLSVSFEDIASYLNWNWSLKNYKK